MGGSEFVCSPPPTKNHGYRLQTVWGNDAVTLYNDLMLHEPDFLDNIFRNRMTQQELYNFFIQKDQQKFIYDGAFLDYLAAVYPLKLEEPRGRQLLDYVRQYYGQNTYQELLAPFLPIEDFYERLNLEAVNIFGSDRLGMMKLDTTIYAKRIKAHTQNGDIEVDSVLYIDSALAYRNKYQRPLGKKRFELKDHLGNVQAVITDKKTAIPDTTNEYCNTDHYKANTVSSYWYYPFGMMQPGRRYEADTSESYRFGFNGMEKDDEMKGSGNSYDFGARIYDPRIGRWLSRDPKEGEYPMFSTYSSFENNPIFMTDPDGQSGVAYVNQNNGTITIKSTIIFYGGAANSKIATETAASIQKQANENSGSVSIDGKTYEVKFEVSGKYRSVEGAKRLAAANSVGEGNPEINFARVGDIDIGASLTSEEPGNSFFFQAKDLGDGNTTDAHEVLTHGMNLGHYPKGTEISGQPDIRTTAYEKVDPEYQNEEGYLDKKSRVVSETNVSNTLKNNGVLDSNNWKKTGDGKYKTNVRKADNPIYNENEKEE